MQNAGESCARMVNSASDGVEYRPACYDEIVPTAKRIQRENGFVYLLFLNAGFQPMIKSWICNIVKLEPALLRSMIFVTTERRISEEMSGFHDGLQLFVEPSNWTSGASFGSFEYFSIVWERMRVQNALVQEGVSVQIIEADQIWNTNINAQVRRALEETIIFAGSEGRLRTSTFGRMKRICGGFYGVHATERARQFYKCYFLKYTAHLAAFKTLKHDLKTLKNFFDDQDFLTRLTAEENIPVKFASSCFYSNGEWYSSWIKKFRCPKPSVLHNNFITGTGAKIERAKRYQQWFIKEDSAGKEHCDV